MKKMLVSIAAAFLMAALIASPAAAAWPDYRVLDTVAILSDGDDVFSVPAGRISSFTAMHEGSFDYPRGGMVSASGDSDRAAYVKLDPRPGTAKFVRIEHLEGIANDSFNLFVRDENNRWLRISGYNDESSNDYSDDLAWYTDTFDITKTNTGRRIELAQARLIQIKIVPTGAEWPGFETWGQLQIAKVELLGR